mmetsp:Transcript_15649/g.45154  ORF Transcript_15649/g.45154 Transcript_15649/m.45154 type:complete len:404 (-) Transcript_15649:69-1280(-)
MMSRRFSCALVAAWSLAGKASGDALLGEDEGDHSCALSLRVQSHPGKAGQGLFPHCRKAPPLEPGTASCDDVKPTQCIFPFSIDGVEYASCTSYGYPGVQWCATAVDQEGRPTEGMRCAEDCPQNRGSALEVCKKSSMKPPGRCGSEDVSACLTGACPARCEKYNTFPWPGASPAYSAWTGFPAMNDFNLGQQMDAVRMLGDFAPGFNRSAEMGDFLHSTLDYICCQNTTTTVAYKEALKSFEFSWTDVGPITWNHVGCSLDNVEHPSIVYLEAFTDIETNMKLLNFTGRIEEHMRRKGFEVANPRVMPFHFVISMVPVEAKGVPFNAADALKALSKYDFGTTYLCEMLFAGLPGLGIPKTFGGELLVAKDFETCPSATTSFGKKTKLTWRGVEIAIKVDLTR